MRKDGTVNNWDGSEHDHLDVSMFRGVFSSLLAGK